jgi:uncharacterized membrane protein
MNALTTIPSNVWIILAGALVTYATRFGGHLVISRLKRVPPRVNVALNAVPAAVITTLVAPGFVQNGVAEIITLLAAIVLGFRLPMMVMFLVGWAMIVALRAAGV